MAQQTAVEWLVKILIEMGELDEDTNLDSILIASAKQMEKQQIMDAHLTGLIHPLETEATKQAEEYYNQTFGK